MKRHTFCLSGLAIQNPRLRVLGSGSFSFGSVFTRSIGRALRMMPRGNRGHGSAPRTIRTEQPSDHRKRGSPALPQPPCSIAHTHHARTCLRQQSRRRRAISPRGRSHVSDVSFRKTGSHPLCRTCVVISLPGVWHIWLGDARVSPRPQGPRGGFLTRRRWPVRTAFSSRSARELRRRDRASLTAQRKAAMLGGPETETTPRAPLRCLPAPPLRLPGG